MNDLVRSYCFSLLEYCRMCNLKNIALTWVTLGKSKTNIDTLHSFQTNGKIQIFLNVYILLYTYMLLYNVKLQSLQIASSKSASSLDVFFFNSNVSSNFLEQVIFCKMRSNFVFLTNSDFPTLLWHLFLLISSAGKIFWRNKDTPFCLI